MTLGVEKFPKFLQDHIGKFNLVFVANVTHISPYIVTEKLFENSKLLLKKNGLLVVYGPFKINGNHVGDNNGQSNQDFDESLKKRNSTWGYRCRDGEIKVLAEKNGFKFWEGDEYGRGDVPNMPANNFMFCFEKQN